MRKFTDAELELFPKVAGIMGPREPDLTGLPREMMSDYIRECFLEHDCLEWLRKHQWDMQIDIFQEEKSRIMIKIYDQEGNFHSGVGLIRAPTFLEALYQCIIEARADV